MFSFFSSSFSTFSAISSINFSCISFGIFTKAGAESANYPFCTIEPNIGVVSVPDERLNVLAKMFNAKRIVPTYIEFVDIAGLVKGASKGEGLRK